jgi:hypothetical protein
LKGFRSKLPAAVAAKVVVKAVAIMRQTVRFRERPMVQNYARRVVPLMLACIITVLQLPHEGLSPSFLLLFSSLKLTLPQPGVPKRDRAVYYYLPTYPIFPSPFAFRTIPITSAF